MSNADDRCLGCGKTLHAHAREWLGHSFVEPAPEPEPSGATIPIPRCPTVRLTETQYDQLIANHTAEPSGDEAKVREIALRWAGRDGVGASIDGAVREAYAAGKADGARAAMELAELASRDRWPHGWRSKVNRAALKLIARRGSEGT